MERCKTIKRLLHRLQALFDCHKLLQRDRYFQTKAYNKKKNLFYFFKKQQHFCGIHENNSDLI